MEVYVDTNAIGLRQYHHKILEATTSLVAFPLDGDSPYLHGLMRGHALHFDIIIGHLVRLRQSKLRIKINTVVSALNKQSLPAIGALLCNYPIAEWSLYQFWPQDSAAYVSDAYYISDAHFRQALSKIPTVEYPFVVETHSILERHNTYFFVTHDGNVYANDPSDIKKYLMLGSVFDDNSIFRWQRVAKSSIRHSVRPRYAELLLHVTPETKNRGT